MKMIFSIFLFSLASCANTSAFEKEDKFIKMHQLWMANASLFDVKKAFGESFKNVENGISYNFSDSRFPEMAFFFDKSNKLKEQFAFLNEASLLNFKKAVKCDWKETEETKEMAHYSRTIKKGSCPNLSISYETYLNLNAYEVRWKR
ncbi:MAG: hypothetical protein JNM93_04140 [Bacteriovoracaceae bacterium]|nr:hypothetical protein [Bacteriovoracaceae bacterium]